MYNGKGLNKKEIKDIGNLFRLEKELNYTAIKDIEVKGITDVVLRNIKNLFMKKKKKTIINQQYLEQ